MNGDRLVERRKWFRVFPEGTLEFSIITRVLALMMMMALAVVGGTQRPVVLVGLLGVLWIDHVLLLWWAIQVAMDLRFVSGKAQADGSARVRARVAFVAALPSVAAVAALMPWEGLITLLKGTRPESGLWMAVPVGAAVAFFAMLVPASRALRTIELGSSGWTVLLSIPLLNYFALHRIAGGLDVRIREQLRGRGLQESDETGPSAALIAADVTWVLSVLPWLVVIGVAVIRGWPVSSAFKAGPVCGTLLAAVFAIANLAALESVQRRIVTLIRKA